MIIKKDDRNFNDDSNTSLQKIAIKKRASHPSSVGEPDLDFRKLVFKLKQAKHHEIRRNSKAKATICQLHPNHYFTNKQYS